MVATEGDVAACRTRWSGLKTLISSIIWCAVKEFDGGSLSGNYISKYAFCAKKQTKSHVTDEAQPWGRWSFCDDQHSSVSRVIGQAYEK